MLAERFTSLARRFVANYGSVHARSKSTENLGTLPFYKIGGKILYKQSDIQAMLERHYNPIPQTGKL